MRTILHEIKERASNEPEHNIQVSSSAASEQSDSDNEHDMDDAQSNKSKSAEESVSAQPDGMQSAK